MLVSGVRAKSAKKKRTRKGRKAYILNRTAFMTTAAVKFPKMRFMWGDLRTRWSGIMGRVARVST